jgi:signal transduction histidine kinase
VEKLKSTFVAIVSHELRTPLSAILGYAEMFKETVYGPMNEKQVNMADRIIKNTQRLLGLINDLLDQAQMEAGKLTVKMGPIKPAELLETLHGLMDKTAFDKNLRLTSEIEDSLPETLNGDPASATDTAQFCDQCHQVHRAGRSASSITQQSKVGYRGFRYRARVQAELPTSSTPSARWMELKLEPKADLDWGYPL